MPRRQRRRAARAFINRDDWPFEYADTASGKAGIGAINARLAGQRIAIVGLGGTGSYILDLVAKCPVGEIHLYDSDRFSSHNAFRAPGAASLEEVRIGKPKVEYFADNYSLLKRKIVPHAYDIDEGSVMELCSADFVFLAMEGGATKRAIVETLEAMNKPFVNASLGVKKPGRGDMLQANVEINGSTVDNRESFQAKVDFGEIDPDDPYTDNIQVADLNALNAAMAVLWWKKWSGVYVSSKHTFWMLTCIWMRSTPTDADEQSQRDHVRIRRLGSRSVAAGDAVHLDEVPCDRSPLPLRVRREGSLEARPRRLELHVRWSIDLSPRLDWKCGSPVPVPLLCTRESSRLASATPTPRPRGGFLGARSTPRRAAATAETTMDCTLARSTSLTAPSSRNFREVVG